MKRVPKRLRNQSARRFKKKQASAHAQGLRPLRYEPLEDRRMLAVVTVDTELDVVDFNDGVTSLREAIYATNLVTGPDEIVFDFGHDGPASIVLTEGELEITDNLTITGSGAELLTIDASGNDPTPDENNWDGSRVFFISDGAETLIDVEISGVTLTGGDVTIVDRARRGGGAIYSSENLSLLSSVVIDNSSLGPGGAIHIPESDLTVIDSVIAYNHTSSSGGGIYSNLSSSLENTGVLNISSSSVINNYAGGFGGGIYREGPGLTVSESVIQENSAGSDGGGIYFYESSDESTINLEEPSLLIEQSQFLENSSEESGGGLYAVNLEQPNSFSLISDSSFVNNSSEREGGGIYREGPELTISGSLFQSNSAGFNGGGIYFYGTLDSDLPDAMEPILQIRRSTFDDNSSEGGGGGLYARISEQVSAFSLISDSSFINNSSEEEGGGLSLGYYLVLNMVNSTVSSNSSNSDGGGIYLNQIDDEAENNIAHSTITLNTSAAGSGGGISLQSGDLSLEYTIVARNTANTDDENDIDGTVTAHFSLIGDNAGSNSLEAPVGQPDANGNLIGSQADGIIDPLLGPLQDNGGPTLTHALLEGSPAINVGDLLAVAGEDGVPLYDQRGEGYQRIVGRLDIGAFENQEITDLNLLVDTLVDESDGDYSLGDLSLREAIELANAHPGHDTIRFDTSLFDEPPPPPPRVVAQTANQPSTSSQVAQAQVVQAQVVQAQVEAATAPIVILLTMGELVISDDLTITGLGAEYLTIDASGNDPTPYENNGDGSRVFLISDGVTSSLVDVTLTDLTITGGEVGSSTGGGAIYSLENLSLISSVITGNSSSGSGGAIRMSGGSLTVDDSVISNNNTSASGGGIYSYTGRRALNDGNLIIISSSILNNNSSGGIGGGIYRKGPGLVISGSVIQGNATQGTGGGLYATNTGQALVSDSTFSYNSSDNAGGGLYLFGDLVLDMVNSTVSSNSSSSDGGGIYISQSEGLEENSIANSTITLNSSDEDLSGDGSGGGIFIQSGELLLDHTIVAGNIDNSAVADEIAGVFSSHYSLIGYGAEYLGPLQDNGGPTPTHALLEGSPAIDAGDPLLSQGDPGLPEFDQRGTPFVRVFDGRIDIGAFEAQPTDGAIAGDVDGDDLVGGSDFMAWMRGYGSDEPTYEDGDITENGSVDGDDLTVWQETYGEENVSAEPSSSDPVQIIEELVLEEAEVGSTSDDQEIVTLTPSVVDHALGSRRSLRGSVYSPGRRSSGGESQNRTIASGYSVSEDLEEELSNSSRSNRGFEKIGEDDLIEDADLSAFDKVFARL